MNAKKNYLKENEEVDLGILLRHLCKEKIIIICLSILFAILFYIYIIILPKKYQSQIFIQKPPSVLFSKYDEYYDLNLGSLEVQKSQRNVVKHENLMEKIVDDNFIAYINFDEFKNFYKKINFENIRFEKVENKKDTRKSYIIIYPEGVDGYSIVRNYADFILSISKEDYKVILKLDILNQIQNLEKHLSIANKIELARPLELLPEKNITANSLYLKGV
jgi:LPS O-antigen subunit length determinant protein (WzzB/FepE family)